MGQFHKWSVQTCPCSAHFLPQPSKTEAGHGNRGSNRTVTHCFWTSGPYRHSESCSFFSQFLLLILWVCRHPLPVFLYRSLHLKIGSWDPFAGATFCFCWFMMVLCFFSFGVLLEVEIGVVGSDFCRFASFPPSSSQRPTSVSKWSERDW